ncbi:ABC transporter ATP-binding protein [Ornithinimicrobium ciconiae]|uniref:ABC transporter ATP-binding protein n=1 Tax=Ornithinimicrobium ciconiae TaxID=2594265 RepID=A0A516G6K2_9MICO|nr:ABC transporter ATP-binding protein [Ornithinimicrobium ciconiae]QDO87102.1 ABC transporter ATP-binding protein [Ornithinimicrobium ciconiae]
MAAPDRDGGAPGGLDTPGAAQDRAPSVIASHLSITYRVFSPGRQRDDEDEETSALKRLLSRSSQGVGVREVEAVKDVSFVAYPGESIAVLGRNGSGKSTLLRTIAGLVPPTSGRLWLNGRAALLGVNGVLIAKLSGRRNIWIGCLAMGMTPEEIEAKFDDIAAFADIGEFIEMPMNSYSSGMAARLRFAISTAVVPDILVVDEALSTGDTQFRDRATARIKEIRQQAGTVFMVSHNPSTIQSMCDRALWIDGGRLLADGLPGPVAGLYTRKYGEHRHVWRERYADVHRVIEEQGLEAARDLLRKYEPEGGW